MLEIPSGGPGTGPRARRRRTLSWALAVCVVWPAALPPGAGGTQVPGDTLARAVLGPAGGVLSLAGRVVVTVPAGALASDATVTVAVVTQDAEARLWFHVITADTTPTPPLPFEVQVSTGAAAPQLPVQVAITVAPDWLVRLERDWQPWIYARIVSGGREERYDDFSPVPTAWAPDGGVATVGLHPTYFDDARIPSAGFSAVLMVGAVPPG